MRGNIFKKDFAMMKFLAIFIGSILFSMVNSAYAYVPDKPSCAYIKDKQLFVRKRLIDGSLDTPKPYLIKGLTWLPATYSPENGPNPYNPSERVLARTSPSGARCLYSLVKEPIYRLFSGYRFNAKNRH